MRDQKNVGDVTKSHIPSQWASAVSSQQYVAEHCDPDNMCSSIDMKQNYEQAWPHPKKTKQKNKNKNASLLFSM